MVSIVVRRRFVSVAAEVHAAPAAGVVFAGVVEVEHAVFVAAFVDARRLAVCDGRGERRGDWGEDCGVRGPVAVFGYYGSVRRWCERCPGSAAV